jgi:type VI secretion system protein VasG
MSEYKEAHSVSGLKGSPPGYVGYGKGGLLTEAVRKRPYTVVLLDEVEKAHPDVMELFYQVFDKGMLEDSEGRAIDFKNCVILLTSNVGSDLITRLCADPETAPALPGLAEAIRPELLKQAAFKPAFLGRLVIVPFRPIDDAAMRRIAVLKLDQIAGRVKENHGATLTYTPEVVDRIVARCTEVATGARNVDHLLTGTLLPILAQEFLARMADGEAVKVVEVGVDEVGGFRVEVS